MKNLPEYTKIKSFREGLAKNFTKEEYLDWLEKRATQLPNIPDRMLARQNLTQILVSFAVEQGYPEFEKVYERLHS